MLESKIKSVKARERISKQDKKDQQGEQARGRIQAQQRQLLESFRKTRVCIKSIRATASSAISKKRKHLKLIAARVKKLGAAHRLMPG